MAVVEKIGSVFNVNTSTAGIQFTPAVSALRNGGFVVAWNFVGASIVGQLYDDQAFRSGGEFVVSTTNNNSQFAPDIATLSDGTFVVAWAHEFSATDIDVRARRFSEAGSGFGGDFGIATTGLRDETLPSITAQQNGRYLVTWSQDDNLVNFVQRDAAGNVLSGPGPIDAAPPGAPEKFSSVTALVNGTYVVAFEQGTEIFQRRLVAGANAERANNVGFGVSDRPTIAALEGGGYVAVWRQGGAAGDSARALVAGQIYDAFGNKVGGGFNPVTLAGAVDQTTPVVKGLVGGGFIVVWDDANLGLRALAYDARGNTINGLVQLTPPSAGGSLGNIDVTQKENGDIVVVWAGSDADGVGIQGQILRVFNTVNGTSGNDRLATALTGADSNLNPGFQANDILNGLGGNDTLQGLGGAQDILDGGTGIDTASYIDASSPVTANLLIPAFNNGDAIGDSYISIENLEGSFFGDQLTGNNADNAIDGYDGNDIIEGLGGNDTLIGGAGNDVTEGGAGDDSHFVDRAGDIVIEAVGQGALDRLFSRAPVYRLADGAEIERMSTHDNLGTTGQNLYGNAFVNTIFGNNGLNILDGRGGADTMAGLGGVDFYYVDNAGDVVSEAVGGGYDRVFAGVSWNLSPGAQVEVVSTTNNLGVGALNFRGNEFGNLIFGNAGRNIIGGQGGNDTLYGFGGQDSFLFATTPNTASNVDTLADFGLYDTILLLSSAFPGLPAGTLAASAFTVGGGARDASDRIIYENITGRLFFDADGVGGVAQVQFATVKTVPALTNADFVVV